MVTDVRKLVHNTINEFYTDKLSACKHNKKEKFKLFSKMLGTEKEIQLPSHESEQMLCDEFEQFFTNKIHNIRRKTGNFTTMYS